MTNHINLDDTTNCPLDDRCVHCGATSDLAVATFETPIGVLCRTICGPCGDAGATPPIPHYGTALTHMVRLIFDHCEHLEITIDQMAAVMDAETDQ